MCMLGRSVGRPMQDGGITGAGNGTGLDRLGSSGWEAVGSRVGMERRLLVWDGAWVVANLPLQGGRHRKLNPWL